jgi:hypothetical protein
MKEWHKKNKIQHNLRNKKWHLENPERIKEFQKKHRKTEKYRITAKRINTKYRRNNKMKIFVQKKLQRAVQGRKITKPSVCDICENEYNINCIGGHHEDYSKPYNVIWLCGKCHGLYHRGLCIESINIRVKVKELYNKKYSGANETLRSIY